MIDRLAADLHAAFPDMKGFSTRNLEYMRSLAGAFADAATREWYVRQTIAQGWSRNVLVLQIEAGAHLRQGKALTNFAATLPPPQSDLARDLLKDPYNFDFLTLSEDAQEKHLQAGLLEHVREFLIELGVGFAFVGSRYPLEVGGKDYFLDLLFYHLRLRAFVVIELKVTEFEPEHLGKMNFYLSRGVGTRRERIRPQLFLQMSIPMPMVEQQHPLEINRYEQVRNILGMTATPHEAIMPTVLNRAFNGTL